MSTRCAMCNRAFLPFEVTCGVIGDDDDEICEACDASLPRTLRPSLGYVPALLRSIDAGETSPPEVSKHTPGPWKVENFAGQTNVWSKRKKSEAVCYDCTDADARLIAAAPEMLEALRAVLAAPASYGFKCEELVRAAIKKATET